ncbi:unnamed protein product [Lasius platythorax]
MFARCIEIARSLLISCIVAQLIWLSGGSTPGNEPIETTETTENYHETTISWSDPSPTEPESRIILPSSNLNLRKHPIWKIHIISQGVELSPQELRPLPIMEDDGGEKLRDQVSTGDDVSRAGSDDHRERNYVRVAQGEISRATDERNSPAEEETKVDLSFLDNLGGLAPFLPDVKDSEAPDTLPNEEASSNYSFFDWLMSKLRGTYRESTASDGTIVYEGYSSRLGKSDKTKAHLFPKYRDLYAKLSSANLDPRVRLEMLTELNRPNMTFISETPVNHSEVPPPSPDNYHQSAENNHAQKFSRINAANPPIRNAVDFRRPRHN